MRDKGLSSKDLESSEKRFCVGWELRKKDYRDMTVTQCVRLGGALMTRRMRPTSSTQRALLHAQTTHRRKRTARLSVTTATHSLHPKMLSLSAQLWPDHSE